VDYEEENNLDIVILTMMKGEPKLGRLQNSTQMGRVGSTSQELSLSFRQRVEEKRRGLTDAWRCSASLV